MTLLHMILKNIIELFYDKRYVFDDGINTLAYFHKDIANSSKE